MASSANTKVKVKKIDKLRSKEEEYLRLNAELEEKTNLLINQAETVLKGQDELFNEKSCFISPNGNDFMPHRIAISSNKEDDDDANHMPVLQQRQRPHSARVTSNKKNMNNSAKQIRPKSVQTVNAQKLQQSKQKHSRNLLQERIELANTISTLEEQLTDDIYSPSKDNSGIPDVAEDLGSEATIRFLKAKLRVMQEELDHMSTEANEKDNILKEKLSQMKQIADENTRQQKQFAAVQSQCEKYKKLYDEQKQSKQATNDEVTSLKKELDGMKRHQKQNAMDKNSTDVRLNRALEEIEKYKQSLAKAKETSKDTTHLEKKRFDQLVNDNKRLEKQKSELMTAFKKQLKLIDILKRQKMHIEAAKMLQFSEEEFLKALDWGNA